MARSTSTGAMKARLVVSDVAGDEQNTGYHGEKQKRNQMYNNSKHEGRAALSLNNIIVGRDVPRVLSRHKQAS